jgi:uncharacterized protein (DUF1778 family)
MKTRLEIWIDVSQKEALQRIADKRSTSRVKVSMAALIRDAVQAVIDQERSKKA